MSNKGAEFTAHVFNLLDESDNKHLDAYFGLGKIRAVSQGECVAISLDSDGDEGICLEMSLRAAKYLSVKLADVVRSEIQCITDMPETTPSDDLNFGPKNFQHFPTVSNLEVQPSEGLTIPSMRTKTNFSELSGRLPEVGYVRLPVILSIFPVRPTTWWNGVKSGRFPKGVKLSPNITAWRVEDIRALLNRLHIEERCVMDDENYSNIREILGSLIGKTLIDITQHDEQEFKETRQSYVMLMFNDGSYLRFPVGDEGFDHNVDDALLRQNPPL